MQPPLVMAFAIFFGFAAMVSAIQLRATRDHNRRTWPSMQVGYLGLRVTLIASLMGAMVAFSFLIANTVGGR